MAQGSFYLGRNGEINDTLSRVAFKMTDDDGNQIDSYYFATNPSQMTASYPARNIFNQTISDVLMQGYGEGIHTIQIQGQTGFRQWQIMHRGPTGWDTGYQKYQRIKEIILRQINNAHDNGRPDQMTNLFFFDYTDEVAYRVEPAQQGLQLQRSNQDPLTYYYTIELVVIAPADEPNPDEFENDHIGNSMSTKAEDVPGTVDQNLNPGLKIDRGQLYRQPLMPPNHKNMLADMVDRYKHGYKSILDWGNWPGQDTLEMKQDALNGDQSISDHQKAVIMDVINKQDGNSPLVHVLYNGHRPLDIRLDNTTLNNDNLLYWDKWFHQTRDKGTNQVGVNQYSPTGYQEKAGQSVQTQPNGDKLIYANSGDLTPEAVVTNKGTLYYLNGGNSSNQDNSDNQHVVIDGAGHAINAPQGHNIQYIINYDLACTSHVVQIAPGNPGNHYIGEPIIWQNIHHNVSSAIFTWGTPTSIPINYDAFYRHMGSSGEWTCTTQVTGHGTIYWDGKGNISNSPSTLNEDSLVNNGSQSSLVINSYQIADSDADNSITSLNIDNMQLPSTVMNDEHAGNSEGDSIDTNQYHIPDSSMNYIQSDGLINNYYINSVFDADVSAYYAQNVHLYKVNGSFQTPPFMQSGQVSSDTNNNFDYDFQQAIDDNMALTIGGQEIHLQNYFTGDAAPEDNPNTQSYWSDKGSNYIKDSQNKINPALYKYIVYWISKNLTPQVINQQMSQQQALDNNTDYQANMQAVDESGTSKNGWYYPYNTSSVPANLAQNATNSVYGYYDRDGNIVYDESKSNAHRFLIPVDYDTTFVPQQGHMIINNPGTPGPTDTKEDEAVNNNDIKYANDIGHATMFDGHLIYDPYGKIVIPTNGTMLIGAKLDGHYVKEVIQVSSNTTKTGIPVPSHEYGTNYIRAFYENGNLVPNQEGNIIVPSNGTQIEENSNGEQVIVMTGSNTTPVDNNDYYRANAYYGNLYLDPNGKIIVPTIGTRIENINGYQRIVGTDGSNDWITCINNLQQQLIPSRDGNIYVPRNESSEMKGNNGKVIITTSNGTNPVNPSNYLGNAINIERAAIDPYGNLYLNSHGSIYVPKNGTTTVGQVINGIDEQVIKDVGSNTTSPGKPIPNSAIPNAQDTERASYKDGNLILDKKGNIIVSKNGTMIEQNSNGQLQIIDTGSNTTPVTPIPKDPTVDTGNNNFQYIKNADGKWVLVPKDGIEIINRGGKNYIVNTGSQTTSPGPSTPNNLSNNAISASQMIVNHDGKITIQPSGYSTNGSIPNAAMFNVKQYATDLTTITNKNGQLVIEPNQYSTTDLGEPIPTDLAKNATNCIQIKLANGHLQIMPSSNSTNGTDSNPQYDYGSSNGYMVAIVNNKIKYMPIGTSTNGEDDNPINLAKNATNWIQIKGSNGRITIEPASPGLINGYRANKNVSGNAKATNSFVGGQKGSHTELINNHIVVVPDTDSSLNTILTGPTNINTTVINEAHETPTDKEEPFTVNGTNTQSDSISNSHPVSNNPDLIQGYSSKRNINADK